MTFSCEIVGNTAVDQKFEWEPRVPNFHGRSKRRFEEFRTAYNFARREFFAEVANRIGAGVMVVDLDGKAEVIGPSQPAPKVEPDPLPKDDVFKLAAEIKQWATDLHVVTGPVRWVPKDVGKKWYFTFSAVWPDGFQIIMLEAPDQHGAEECRIRLCAALVEHRPLVIHNMASEIDEARLIEALWPCDRATRLREAVEKEHAEHGR